MKECSTGAVKEIENRRNGDVVGKFCPDCEIVMMGLLNTGVDDMAAWDATNDTAIKRQLGE